MKNELIARGYVVAETEVYKGSQKVKALCVRKAKDDKVGVTIYPDKIENIDEAIVRIESGFLGRDEVAEKAQIIHDYDKVKEKIVPCLRAKTDDNNTYKLDFLDMEIFFRVIVDSDENGVASVKVDQKMLECWGVDDILMQALKNLDKSVRAIDMDKIMMMSLMMGTDDNEELLRVPDAPCEMGMLILTNEKKVNGASAMLDVEYLREIREYLGGDFYILPSSIHEVIAVPTSVGGDPSPLLDMVTDINGGVVSPAERLTDNVYLFNGNEVVYAIEK